LSEPSSIGTAVSSPQRCRCSRPAWSLPIRA
jgi:hypothetical protein